MSPGVLCDNALMKADREIHSSILFQKRERLLFLHVTGFRKENEKRTFGLHEGDTIFRVCMCVYTPTPPGDPVPIFRLT